VIKEGIVNKPLKSFVIVIESPSGSEYDGREYVFVLPIIIV
jgi:hypothetical protein